MENYKLLHRLGKGAQGSVHLAEHRTEGRKYVLKKIECNDESEANKAFKEALALQELQNPYICGYKEFFVTWDKEESAMFVCIVMEYYPKGDLCDVLKQKRAVKEPLEEMVIQKWLGQIIEAIVFVHKKNIIHRDLKPSNIFLQEDLSISIGDFGVASVMSDIRTRTRTAVGTMNWMAPEVLEHPYDERSDVWSMGCIALELITCGILEATEMTGKLSEIKHNPQALEDLLQGVAQTYSKDLLSVTRTMLCRNFKQRPTAEELLHIPYVRDCLALCGSIQDEKQKRHQSSPSRGPLPRDQGWQPVLEYLHLNPGNEDCVHEALEYMATIITEKEAVTMEPRGKYSIISAMKDYISNEPIQIAAFTILSNLIVSVNTTDILYSPRVISIVPLSMKSHAGSIQLQQAAASFLVALSADDGASQQIGDLGGIQYILTAMRMFPNNLQICSTCCNALWTLAVNEDNLKIVTEEKGLEDVIRAMNVHFDAPELVEAAAATLLSLSIADENMEGMQREDCVGLLLQAINVHVKEAKVVKNACMALSSLVEPDEESAYKILSNLRDGAEVQGIPIIIQAYHQHKDNAEVVEGLCTLLMELAEYDEICAELKFQKVGESLLMEVHKRFKDNMDIMEPCESALSKIEGGKLKITLQPPTRNNKQGIRQ